MNENMDQNSGNNIEMEELKRLGQKLYDMKLPTSTEARRNMFKQELKSNLMFEFERKNRKQYVKKHSFSIKIFKVFNHAAVTAFVLPLLVVGSVSSYAYYSPSVYEDHILYPVKLSIEKIEYSFAKTSAEQAEKKLKLAKRRLDEVKAATADNKSLNKEVLSKVATYTLAAIQDISEIESPEEKQELQKEVEGFAKNQMAVLVDLQDEYEEKKSKYITYVPTEKKRLSFENVEKNNNYVETENLASEEKKESEKENQRDEEREMMRDSTGEATRDVTSEATRDAMNRVYTNEENDKTEKEKSDVEMQDLVFQKEDQYKSESVERSEETKDQDPELAYDKYDKIITNDELRITDEGNDKTEEDNNVETKNLASEEKKESAKEDQRDEERETTRDATGDATRDVTRDATRDAMNRVYTNEKNVGIDSDMSAEYKTSGIGVEKPEIKESDEKPQLMAVKQLEIDEDSKALQYIWDISNQVKEASLASSSNNQKRVQKNLYNPRIEFKPSLEDYKIEGEEFLIQTFQPISFYLYHYFVDAFDIYVPESIYNEYVEIYYTKDNSDPFISPTKERYFEGQEILVDRNATLKFVAVSKNTPSPTYVVQVNMIKNNYKLRKK